MGRILLTYAAVAFLVSGIGTIAIVAELGRGKTLILMLMWAVTIILGIRQYRRLDSRDRKELQTWLVVAGDLRLTCPTKAPPDKQHIISIGPGFERVLGWSVDELIGKSWYEFIHPDDRAPSVSQSKMLANGQNISMFVNRWRHKKRSVPDTERWVWLEWTALSDPETGLTYANARDMTTRFEREAQMATWSRITSDLMAVADTAIPIAERKFEWLNEAWSRHLGWDTHELYEMRIVDIIQPENVPKRISRRKNSEGGLPEGEMILHCRVQCKPLPEEPPQYRFYEWTSLQLNGKLYVTGRDVGIERAHEIEMSRAISDLESRNADLERFASVAAHQLRSPPRTIAGIAQALGEDYGHLLDEEGLLFLEDIRTDADQMAEIVDGLYRFSKVRTNDDLVMQPVDLNDLMKHVWRTHTKKLCGVCVTVKTCPPEERPREDIPCVLNGYEVLYKDLPVVLGDPLLIKEVFNNLIDNGFKFNESDVKRIAITSHQRSDGRWSIAVKDNGIGISAKYQPKLFTMFQRVHAGYAGTGVGLALVSAIVNKHGGVVSVVSEPGQGATFIFDLAAAWDS